MALLRISLGSLMALACAGPAVAQEVWSTDGFNTPESVLFDSARDRFYVSNVAGEPNEKDGIGFISLVSRDGKMQEADWVTGLDAPKGLAARGDTLYITDIDRLVAIDIEQGEVSGRWQTEGAQFLNDPAVDSQGRVFVSDMLANRIYVLNGDSLSVWLDDESLLHPNGLAIQDGQLIVAAWGRKIQPDFSTEVPGHLLTVDLQSKEIADLGSGEPIGNLDGLEADGEGGWLATDWVAGALFRIQPDGTSEQLLDLNPGSADLEYLQEDRLAVIPMMMDGSIVAHRIE